MKTILGFGFGFWFEKYSVTQKTKLIQNIIDGCVDGWMDGCFVGAIYEQEKI